MNHRKEVENDLQNEIKKYKDELEELKKTYEACDTESDSLKDKIGKEKTEYELLKNRNKLLLEENAAVTSKYEFITKNYDFTTNHKLKKLHTLYHHLVHDIFLDNFRDICLHINKYKEDHSYNL